MQSVRRRRHIKHKCFRNGLPLRKHLAHKFKFNNEIRHHSDDPIIYYSIYLCHVYTYKYYIYMRLYKYSMERQKVSMWKIFIIIIHSLTVSEHFLFFYLRLTSCRKRYIYTQNYIHIPCLYYYIQGIVGMFLFKIVTIIII